MTAAPVRLERRYAVPIERVFDYMTKPELLARWWGPEHIVRIEGDLDLQQPGPWDSTMISGDGARFRVSGQVTKVQHPTLVAFTWGWHDATGQRGAESHVMIELSAEAGGTLLVLTHRDLRDEEQARLHGEGWTSTLRKLDAALA